jgi:hypothetical protein
MHMSRPFTEIGVVRVEVGPSRIASAVPAHRLRRLAGRLSALLADGGVGARFSAERGHDERLVHRVESRRRL